MKSKTTTEAKTTEPRLWMQVKILSRDRDGQISDMTRHNLFGLNKLTEDGDLACHILSNVRKRLDLLYMAAEGRTSIDAGLVRLAIENLQLDVEEGSHLAHQVELLHELFSNAEAIAPRKLSGAQTTSSPLSST